MQHRCGLVSKWAVIPLDQIRVTLCYELIGILRISEISTVFLIIHLKGAEASYRLLSILLQGQRLVKASEAEYCCCIVQCMSFDYSRGVASQNHSDPIGSGLKAGRSPSIRVCQYSQSAGVTSGIGTSDSVVSGFLISSQPGVVCWFVVFCGVLLVLCSLVVLISCIKHGS